MVSGVVTLIKKDISYYQVVTFDKMEGLSVSVDTVSGPLEIVNIYCPPQEVFDELWLGDQFKWENVLICGNFNAKSVLWGSPESNAKGRVLENILDECDKVVLNTGMAAR